MHAVACVCLEYSDEVCVVERGVEGDVTVGRSRFAAFCRDVSLSDESEAVCSRFEFSKLKKRFLISILGAPPPPARGEKDYVIIFEFASPNIIAKWRVGRLIDICFVHTRPLSSSSSSSSSSSFASSSSLASTHSLSSSRARRSERCVLVGFTRKNEISIFGISPEDFMRDDDVVRTPLPLAGEFTKIFGTFEKSSEEAEGNSVTLPPHSLSLSALSLIDGPSHTLPFASEICLPFLERFLAPATAEGEREGEERREGGKEMRGKEAFDVPVWPSDGKDGKWIQVSDFSVIFYVLYSFVSFVRSFPFFSLPLPLSPSPFLSPFSLSLSPSLPLSLSLSLSSHTPTLPSLPMSWSPFEVVCLIFPKPPPPFLPQNMTFSPKLSALSSCSETLSFSFVFHHHTHTLSFTLSLSHTRSRLSSSLSVTLFLYGELQFPNDLFGFCDVYVLVSTLSIVLLFFSPTLFPLTRTPITHTHKNSLPMKEKERSSIWNEANKTRPIPSPCQTDFTLIDTFDMDHFENEISLFDSSMG